MRNGLAYVFAALLLLGSLSRAQAPAPSPTHSLITAQGRRPLAVTVVRGQEMVATADLATLLQVAARDDSSAGGIALSYKGRTVVVSPDQPMASVAGRLIPLTAPAVRQNRRWLVPIDVLTRALAPIYDAPIEYRRGSRLVIVGNLRVPRVTVKLDFTGPPTRVSVEASPSALITPSTESGRVLLRVDADALDVAPLPQSAGLLEQARVDGTTVVLTLAPGAGQPRTTRATGDNLTRVNVEVAQATLADAGPTQAPAPAPPTTPAAGDGTPPDAAREGVRVVVLDPGHGGADVGATGASGTQEKVLTLAIARRVKSALERLGLRVLLTRDDDVDVSLDARAAIANSNKADIFISLHLNAAWTPEATGAEVYQWQAAVPSAIGGGRTLAIPAAGGGTRSISLVPWNQTQERHVEASTLLTNMVEAALRDRVPMSPRAVQEGPMRLLSAIDAPAVLIEIGYLTSPDQDAALQTDDFQARVAQALADAVGAYRATRGGRTP